MKGVETKNLVMQFPIVDFVFLKNVLRLNPIAYSSLVLLLEKGIIATPHLTGLHKQLWLGYRHLSRNIYSIDTSISIYYYLLQYIYLLSTIYYLYLSTIYFNIYSIDATSPLFSLHCLSFHTPSWCNIFYYVITV